MGDKVLQKSAVSVNWSLSVGLFPNAIFVADHHRKMVSLPLSERQGQK